LRYTVFKRFPDPRVGVGALVLLPCFAFIPILKADQGAAQFLGLKQLFGLGLLVLLVYFALLARLAWQKPSRWGSLIMLLISGTLYASGVARFADTLPDRSTAEHYTCIVDDMREIRGKNSSYSLILGPWGPVDYKEVIEVSPLFYGRIRIGETLCIQLHRGFLHAPWYTLSQCPNYDQH
jgi:hypothetical protein